MPISLSAKSWILLESGSGQVLTAYQPDEKLEPASTTKLMTAYLVFSALRQKNLGLDDMILISKQAQGMGGSGMSLKTGQKEKLEDLIKGMVVASGNDASVALAEAVAGTEEKFVILMNQEAFRLGMKSTRFKNATGFPDPEHVSTARDLSILASALIRDFPQEYANYHSIREFRRGKQTLVNSNLLLWRDSSVDGVKTGFTKAAGYCLVASAKRGERRLLSVVMGADSEEARARESLKLLNWGYQQFDAMRLYEARQPVSTFNVWKGNAPQLKVGFPNDFIISVPKGHGNKLKASLVSRQPLIAPIQEGQVVGMVKISMEGKPYGEYPVMALESVPIGGYFRRLLDSIRLLFV